MKKILIIGNSGYIGSKLSNDYSNEYMIHGIDTGWFTKIPTPTDFNSLTAEYIQCFDVVILLAGHSSVKMCESSLSSAFNNNVRNFMNLLNKMSDKQRLIYASSSSVYGIVGTNIVDETYTNFIPQNHYDVTKYTIDLLAQRSNIEYYGLRFGTVNGYSPRLRSDVMINSMTYSALTDGEIKLYIKDIQRPILGINDLSRAIKTILDSDSDNRGIYNLASFSDTAENIAINVSSVTGKPIKHYEADPTNISNSKLQTKCYDFDIDSSKFIKTYNFEFSDTARSLTQELVNNFSSIEFSNRNLEKIYE